MKTRSVFLATAGAAVLIAMSVPTVAFSQERGEYEYSVGCAQCHGVEGQGDGPIAQYLVDAPPSLTSLSANNGGVFPVDYVIAVLEGTVDIGVHGRDMPLWGPRYRAELMEQFGSGIAQDEAETLVGVRTLSLVEYLASIQAE